MAAPLKIEVLCYAGYKGEQTPKKIILGENGIYVIEILDQWLAPDHRYFKLRGEDRAEYIIRHDTMGDFWELIYYSAESGSRPNGAR